MDKSLIPPEWDIVNINDLTDQIMQIVMAGSIFTQAGQDSIREDIFQHFLSTFHISDII